MSRNILLTRQHGFLLPMAIFILIGLGVLAASLMRMASQGSIATTQEALSVSAFYAAESGAQWSMGVLFYPETDRINTDARCAAMVEGAAWAFSAPGLSACSVRLNCSRTTDAANTISYYVLSSHGRCDIGGIIAERQIEVASQLRDAS